MLHTTITDNESSLPEIERNIHFQDQPIFSNRTQLFLLPSVQNRNDHTFYLRNKIGRFECGFDLRSAMLREFITQVV